MVYDLPPLVVLMATADDARARLIARTMRAAWHGNAVNALQVSTLAACLAVLEQQPVDVILLQLDLPDAFGLDALEHLLTEVRDTPVVVLGDTSQEHLARTAVSAGAQDYLLPSELEGHQLLRVLLNAVERQRLLVGERASRTAAEQARRTRDQILAIVSHDLRAPLNAISLCARGLTEGSADPRMLGHTILQAADWSRRVIRDLLDATAIDRGKFQVLPHLCDVCEIVSRACDLFQPTAREHDITLSSHCPGVPIFATLDADRIQQALDNLIDNAVRATPAGGRIDVTVENDSADFVTIGVVDSGCGMSQERLTSLLGGFGSSPDDSYYAGLGLRIANTIVALHDGSLRVERTPGGGSHFAMRLPVTTRR